MTAVVSMRSRSAQAGATLVDLMIALALALFILLGLVVMFMHMKTSFTAQDRLSLLQDNERLALTILTASVRAAGYFPDPTASTPEAELPAASGPYGVLAAGQGLVGTGGAGGQSDTLTSRYSVAPGDMQLVNCLGQANTGPTPLVFTNTFSISAAQELLCSTDGGATATPLVSGVSSLSVAYGTDTAGSGQADRYLGAADVTAGGLWPQVRTARITLAFRNPFAGQPGQPDTVSWVQTVNLMNRT
jgi:type IV pilus assembly protein PilW